MKQLDRITKNLMRTIILIAVPCFGTAVGSPDVNCNPATDPPASGNCTWYNFYALPDNGGIITSGSSFQNYYVASGDPAWTLTTVGSVSLRVLDGGHQGDTFQVFDNASLVGTTSTTPIDADHVCALDPHSDGTDPAACWNDPLMSRGTFTLGPGDHSLTVVWDQRVPGGMSALQWFEVGALADDVPAPVPEPASMLLWGAGLIVLGLLRRGMRSPVQQDLTSER